MFALAVSFALLTGQRAPSPRHDKGFTSNAYWHLPATIEALRDVKVEPFDYQKPEERGVLYLWRTYDKPFQIRKGERFQMIRLYPEGSSCRIRFKGKEHELASCRWIEGFTDQQPDIYRVISGHTLVGAKGGA